MAKETNWQQENQETTNWKYEKTKINTENKDNFPILVYKCVFCDCMQYNILDNNNR